MHSGLVAVSSYDPPASGALPMAARPGGRMAAALVAVAATLTAGVSVSGTRALDRVGIGSTPASMATVAGARDAFDRRPMTFEANAGQSDSQVKFISRGAGYTLFLTPTEAVAQFRAMAPDVTAKARTAAGRLPGTAPPAPTADVRMTMVGANPAPAMTGQDRLSGVTNYFVGNDPSKWHTGIPSYSGVTYSGIYPGIDMVYHGGQGPAEYDFVVAPGADASQIALRFQGAGALSLDKQGNLLLHPATGDVSQHRPVIYQEIGGTRHEVPGSFVVSGTDQVGFRVGAHDRSRPLTIDPTLLYSSYLGGTGGFSGDLANDVAVDSAGKAYIVGTATSPNFPTKNPYQGSKIPGPTVEEADAFIAAFDPSAPTGAASLLYSSYYGSGGEDRGKTIAVDNSGHAFIGGLSALGGSSPSLPAVNAYQPIPTPGNPPDQHGFVAEFDTTATGAGSLLYSSNWPAPVNDLVLGSGATVYFTGTVNAPTTIPVTAATAVQATAPGSTDAFLTKLDTAAGAVPTALNYSTYLGGSAPDDGSGVAVDPTGKAYVVGDTWTFGAPSGFPVTAKAYQGTQQAPFGSDGFVTEVDTAAVTKTTALVYSTYLGGSGVAGFGGDSESSVVLDTAGRAYVGGVASDTDFPVKNAYQPALGNPTDPSGNTLFNDGTITILDTSQSVAANTVVYATYFGGNGDDAINDIAVDATKNVYVSGPNNSSDFPSLNSFLPRETGFIAKLTPPSPVTQIPSLIYSTYIGGGDPGEGPSGIALDSGANVYASGTTRSPDLQTTANARQRSLGSTNGFLMKIGTGGDQIPIVSQVQPRGGDAAGGMAVLITGSRFNGITGVSIGGAPVTSFTVLSSTQIAAILPPRAATTFAQGRTYITVSKAGQPTSLISNGSRFVYGDGSFAVAPSRTADAAMLYSSARSAPLAGGRVLVVSAFTSADQSTSGLDSEVYDPVNDQFTATGGTNPGFHQDFTLTPLADGTVLMAGGINVPSGTTETTDGFLFNPASNAGAGGWSTQPSLAMHTARGLHTATRLVDGRVVVAGGLTTKAPATPTPTAEIYDPVAHSWAVTGPLSVPRWDHAASLLTPIIGNCADKCGRVLVEGGLGPDSGGLSTALRTAELFDPSANSGAGAWTTTGSLVSARGRHTATQVLDGTVLAAGGVTDTVDRTGGNSAELYDPAAGTWRFTGILNFPRSGGATALLPSGKVLYVGGVGGIDGVTRDVADVYDPATGQWSTTGAETVTDPTNDRQTAITATLIPGLPAVCGAGCGKVLVGGGAGVAMELYTPPAARSTLVGAAGTDSALYAKTDGSAYRALGGLLIGAPSIVSVPTDSGVKVPLYIAVSGDHRLYVRSDNTGYRDLVPAGVGCLDNPAAAVTPASAAAGGYTLTVACEGLDHASYYGQTQVGGATLPVISGFFAPLGGLLLAGPAVAPINGVMTFFAEGTDHMIYARTAAAGNPYLPIGAGCIGHPAVANAGPDAYFACQGLDGALYYSKNSAGAGWGPFHSAGGQLIDGPGIAPTLTGATIFVEGGDQSVYHTVIDLAATSSGPYAADGGLVKFGVGAAGLR